MKHRLPPARRTFQRFHKRSLHSMASLHPLARGHDETDPDPSQVAPFGTILGYASGTVPCYSCDYDSDRGGGDYHVAINGVFTGYKWQCVEFARRYLVMTSQFTFASIPMAYHIFQLDFVVRVSDNIKFPLIPCVNGSTRHPRAGELLIWRAGGKKIGRTGHVAIILEASSEWVRIAEQNWDDVVWKQPGYGRQLPATVDAAGKYYIQEPYMLGWMQIGETPIGPYEFEEDSDDD